MLMYWEASPGFSRTWFTHHVISSCNLLVSITRVLSQLYFLFLSLTKLPHPNTIFFAAVACRGSSSNNNTGPAAVACRGGNSCNNTGLAAVACRGNRSNSSNGLAAVVSLININVAPILFLPPGRRDSSRHGESLRSELAGSTTAEQRRIRPGGLTSSARRTDVYGIPLWPLRQTWAQVRTLCCTASFEGICGACGQCGHMWRNCALSSRQPHLNILTSSGEYYLNDAHGADTIVIPQQQHHQPAVDLGGEDIPFQQPSDTMHYSIGMSGGGRGDGDALGTGAPSGGGDNDDDD